MENRSQNSKRTKTSISLSIFTNLWTNPCRKEWINPFKWKKYQTLKKERKEGIFQLSKTQLERQLATKKNLRWRIPALKHNASFALLPGSVHLLTLKDEPIYVGRQALIANMDTTQFGARLGIFLSSMNWWRALLSASWLREKKMETYWWWKERVPKSRG